MTGGLMMSGARLALLAASGLFVMGAATAQAADLGGDCCADLEERVAELEATTARKGNRKVKLAIYGHVNEAVMFWDDGGESNVYQVTNDNSRTRFGFKGDAKITDDWKAGFLIEIGIRTANSKRVDQIDDEGTLNGAGELDLRHAYWFLDSKSYGRLTVGHTGAAAEGVTEINLAQTKDIAKYSDVEDSGLGMFLRKKGTKGDSGLSGLEWRRLIQNEGDQPGEGERREVVKWDSPTIAGFTATAGWGEDDYWDMGLRYAGEFGGFKIAAGIAYGENSENKIANDNVFFECLAQGGQINTGSSDADCNQVGGSISVQHEASGIYVNFAAGLLTDELIQNSVAFVGTGADDENTFWAVEAGIEKKFIDLGKTTFFAQYYMNEGGANARSTVANGDAINPFVTAGNDTARIFNTELEMWGGGVVQSLDSAAMALYLYYRHYEAEMTVMQTTSGVDPTAKADLDDLDIVMGGAIIKF